MKRPIDLIAQIKLQNRYVNIFEHLSLHHFVKICVRIYIYILIIKRDF